MKTLKLLLAIGMILSGYGFKRIEITIKKEWKSCCKSYDDLPCPHRYKDIYNDAEKYISKKEFGTAILRLKESRRQATLLGANTDSINYRLAQTYAFQGNYHQAWTSICLVDNSIGEYFLFNKGIYALKDGCYKCAISNLSGQLREYRSTKHERYSSMKHKCHWGIGFALMKMNQNKDALNEFYQALSYKENLDVRLGIVALCFKLNQPLRAKEELIKAVKRHPLNQQVKQYLANILLNEGKVSKAGALMLFSDKDASYASLIASANLNFRKGNLDNALELYKKAKAINTDGEEALLGLGNTYFAKNKYDKAQEYWNVVLKKNPSNPMALEGLGMINFKEDRDSIAFEYYQKAIKQNPNYQFSYDAYISFGYILLNHDNIGSASQCFSYAINLKKRNPWARAGLGFCLAQNPGFIYNKLLYSEANRQFKKAVKMDSEVPNFFAYLGITEHLMEKNNRAVKHLEKAMAENPGDSRMLIAIANCYAALYQFEKAKDAIGKAMQMDSKNPEYLVNAGAIECSYAEYLTIKNIPADVDSVLGVMQHYYDKALQAGADTSLIRINTGVGFLGSGRFDSALVYYNKITRTDSLISAAKLNNIGVVMAMKNEMEDAKEYFNKAGSFDANSRYSVIGNNILSSAVEGSLRERQFTSIFYFYPALSDFNPEIGFDLNVPVVAALPMPPGELEEGFSYQNYKHFKYVIEVRAVAKIKQPTHKPWGHCPGS